MIKDTITNLKNITKQGYMFIFLASRCIVCCRDYSSVQFDLYLKSKIQRRTKSYQTVVKSKFIFLILTIYVLYNLNKLYLSLNESILIVIQRGPGCICFDGTAGWRRCAAVRLLDCRSKRGRVILLHIVCQHRYHTPVSC